MTSIFEGQPPQNKAQTPIKQGAPIWVLGNYINDTLPETNSKSPWKWGPLGKGDSGMEATFCRGFCC